MAEYGGGLGMPPLMGQHVGRLVVVRAVKRVRASGQLVVVAASATPAPLGAGAGAGLAALAAASERAVADAGRGAREPPGTTFMWSPALVQPVAKAKQVHTAQSLARAHRHRRISEARALCLGPPFHVGTRFGCHG